MNIRVQQSKYRKLTTCSVQCGMNAPAVKASKAKKVAVNSGGFSKLFLCSVAVPLVGVLLWAAVLHPSSHNPKEDSPVIQDAATSNVPLGEALLVAERLDPLDAIAYLQSLMARHARAAPLLNALGDAHARALQPKTAAAFHMDALREWTAESNGLFTTDVWLALWTYCRPPLAVLLLLLRFLLLLSLFLRGSSCTAADGPR